MKMTAKEILIRARNLISKPDNWCKNTAARKKLSCNGGFASGFFPCGGTDPEACQWCASGAVDSVITTWPYYDIYVSHARAMALRALDEACPYQSIVSYNDFPATSHRQILDIFNKAIERLDTPKIEEQRK